jgi:hypothetical protein
MVLHQAKGMHEPTGLQTRLGEGPDELMPVRVVEDRVSRHGSSLIHGAGVLDWHFARQETRALAEPTPQVKRG